MAADKALPLLVTGLLVVLLVNCDAVGARPTSRKLPDLDPDCLDPSGNVIPDCGSGSSCFPGDATVHLPGGRSKLMRELQLGDKVAVWEKATGRIAYDDVYAFGHKDASAVSEFVRIVVKADDSREPSSVLELTSHHFVPTAHIPGPALITVRQAVKNINKRRHLKELERLRGRDPSSAAPEAFVCQRVCTSKRMLARVGAFSKDPTPGTCVVACGVSEVDACADACARVVCAIPHHVPAWNDVCMRRCQELCLKDNEQQQLF